MSEQSAITHPKKLAFLENYKKFKRIHDTAKAIGVGVSTVYQWLQEDDVLSDKAEVIKKEIDAERLELYEAELDKRALTGSKQSDILLMFGLKALNRDKYEGKQAQAFQGTIIIQSPMPKPDYVEGIEPKLLTEGENDIGHPSAANNGNKEY